ASTRYSVLTAGFSVVKFVLPLALLPLIDPLAALLWGTTIATILNWFVLVRQTPAAAREGTVGSPRELREMGQAMVHFGLPLSVWEIGVQILQYSDRYAIAALLGAAAVGLYSTNYSIAEKLLILVQAPLVYAAHPPIMASWERGQRAEAEDLIQTATRWL